MVCPYPPNPLSEPLGTEPKRIAITSGRQSRRLRMAATGFTRLSRSGESGGSVDATGGMGYGAAETRGTLVRGWTPRSQGPRHEPGGPSTCREAHDGHTDRDAPVGALGGRGARLCPFGLAGRDRGPGADAPETRRRHRPRGRRALPLLGPGHRHRHGQGRSGGPEAGRHPVLHRHARVSHAPQRRRPWRPGPHLPRRRRDRPVAKWRNGRGSAPAAVNQAARRHPHRPHQPRHQLPGPARPISASSSAPSRKPAHSAWPPPPAPPP